MIPMQWIPIPSTRNLRTIGVHFHKQRTLDAAKVLDTRVSDQQISVSLAASLGLSSIFSVSGGLNSIGFWLDAMAYTDQFEPEPAAGNLVLATRFGFGLRILFRLDVLNVKANINYSSIGAAVDAEVANATYEIDAIGLGPDALPTILGSLAQSGALLNGDTFRSLNTDVIKNLTTYIKAHIAELKPQRVAALLQSTGTGDSLDLSLAVLFAIRKIQDGTSLHDALQAAGDLDSASIRLAYEKFLGDVPDTTQPSRSQEDAAGEWLADD